METTRSVRCVLMSLFEIVLISLLSTLVFAQTATLRGTITDAETGEALPGANVVVTSTNVQTGAAAISTGKYEVKNLPAGTYTVTVSYIGYEKKVITDIVLSAGETKSLDISLTLTGIQINPISVTASRHPEKVLEAPADVNVLEATQIEARPVLTPSEHLKSLPAVDVVSSGLNQANVVVRGFNNVFSGALLSLVDNRYARVPSLRLNAYQFIPTTNEDIERVEVVLGPGSALYGPNSASGVMHILTKSPFGSEGTTVSVGGGERSVFMSSFRHAGSYNKIGYKFSFQYYQGNDWKTTDSAEPDTISFFRQTEKGRIRKSDPFLNKRDFDIEKIAGEGRLDFRLSDDLTIILNGGFNQGSNIELTGIGAAQAKDWTYSYIQGRLRYKDLFLQAFMNRSDAGDTYLLRTGDLIVDNSKLIVGQIQHSISLGDRQRFTYGFDALLTRPDTDNTINGRNEKDDDINEYGVYLQSETDISSKLKFVGAARIDNHNHIDDAVFSPRAALVFKPNLNHNFRATFNRAFSTPTTNNLFLDILSGTFPTAAANPALIKVIGETIFNVRARGTIPSGFTFNIGADNRPQMVSLYGAALAQAGAIPAPNTYLPPDVNPVWPVIRQLAIGGAPPEQQAFLNAVLPQQLSQTVAGVFAAFNTETQGFDPVSPSVVKDIKPTFETTTTTFEFGYKGLIMGKIIAGVDVYHSKIKDFVGPLRVETPNVFINPQTFVPVLTQDIVVNGEPFGITPEIAQQIATGIAQNFAALPIGLISPKEVQNATDIILTYRNFGDISVTGLDLSFSYFINRNWTISGNYSYVNKDFFKNVDGLFNIALNAPKNKFGGSIQYQNSEAGFDGQLRLRFVDTFPVDSGVYKGTVQSYAVLDLNANYRLPFATNTRLSLTIQNLTDNNHKEIVGAPEIGRLALVRLTQSF